MKTIQIIRKNILSKLIRALMFVAFFCFGLKANAQCTAGYTYTVNPLLNGSVSFTNTSTSSSSTLYYSWNFGDGSFDYSANPVHIYNTTGTFNVCLSIYDSVGLVGIYDSTGTTGGCYNTFCNYISVTNDSTPTGGSTDSTGTGSGCYATINAINDMLGTGASFTSSVSGSIDTYFWDFGDGATSNLANPHHTYAAAGTYTACLHALSSTDTTCGYTTCINVTFPDSTGSGTDTTGTGSGCYASINFVNDSTGMGVAFTSSVSGSVDTYSWDFGDGTTSTVANPHHIYAANGTYSVCLHVSSSTDTTCGYTTCTNVNIGSSGCTADFVIVQDSTNLFNYFVYSNATISSAGMPVSYLWSFGDGTTSTLEYPTHTYTISSPVDLCLTITDSACTATHCDSIIPGHASSGFTINVVPGVTTGIHEQTNIISSLENYPNPFSDNTTISYSIKQNASVELSIIDLLGNKIAVIVNGNKTTGSYSTTWNSEDVSRGMYLLQLRVNNNISTKKIIISK